MKDQPRRRRKGNTKRRPLKPKATSPSRHLRILVVEDDADLREGLEAYFTLLGHRAQLVADAALAQAAGAVRGQPPSG
jgi:hypothetical protein